MGNSRWTRIFSDVHFKVKSAKSISFLFRNGMFLFFLLMRKPTKYVLLFFFFNFLPPFLRLCLSVSMSTSFFPPSLCKFVLKIPILTSSQKTIKNHSLFLTYTERTRLIVFHYFLKLQIQLPITRLTNNNGGLHFVTYVASNSH